MTSLALVLLAAQISWGDAPPSGKKPEKTIGMKQFDGSRGSGRQTPAGEEFAERWARDQVRDNQSAEPKPGAATPPAAPAGEPFRAPERSQPAAPASTPEAVGADESLRDAPAPSADRPLARAGGQPEVEPPPAALGDGAPSGASPLEARPGPLASARGGASPSSKGAKASSRARALVRRAAGALAPDEKLRDSPGSPGLAAVRGALTAAGPIGRPAAGPKAAPVSPDKLDKVFDAQPARPAEEPKAGPAAPEAKPDEFAAPAPAPSPTPSVDCAAAPQGGACGRGVPVGGPGLVTEDSKPSPPAPVFVSLDLDVTATPGQYRDAVAGLGRDAGFKLDGRFAPVYRGPDRDRVSVWGWLPHDKLREAATLKGVERVEAAPQAQAAPAAAGSGRPAAESQWRLVLRLPKEAAPESAIAAALLRLSDLGFTWKSTESRDQAGLITVLGTMPTRSVQRALADPAVVRLEARRTPAPAPAPAPVKASAGPTEELGRLLRNHPVLLLLAALFPLIGSLLKSR